MLTLLFAFRLFVILVFSLGGMYAIFGGLHLGVRKVPEEAMGMFFLMSAMMLPICLIGLAVIAIGWHRFSLLGEDNGKFLIWPSRGLVWPYVMAVIKLLLFGLFLLFIFFIFMSIFMLIFGKILLQVALAAPLLHFLINFLVQILLTTLMLGMSLLLPAAAVGARMRLGEAWRFVWGHFSVLFIVSAIVNLLNLGLEWVFGNAGLAVFPFGEVLGGIAIFAASLFVSWFMFMLGIGYVSETYGTYFVDGDENAEAEPSPQPGQ